MLGINQKRIPPSVLRVRLGTIVGKVSLIPSVFFVCGAEVFQMLAIGWAKNGFRCSAGYNEF